MYNVATYSNQMQPIKFGSLFDYKTAKNGYFQKIKASERYRLEFIKNHLLYMPRSEADNSLFKI